MRDFINIINEALTEYDFKVGDEFGISFDSDLEIGTVISEVFEDGVLIEVDDYAISIMESHGAILSEAEYKGREVELNKPMRGDVKKFKVYVKNAKGNVVKVNFGDPDMRIRKSNPARRKSFRARHNCDNPGPKDKARYWSCRKW